MLAPLVVRDPQYVFNHCTKFLARDNRDARHNYYGTLDGQARAAISEPWRFPIVDAHDGDEPDADEWNDVTFVYTPFDDAQGGPGREPVTVSLLCTAHALYDAIP